MNPQKKKTKFRRNLFQKAAIGVLFVITLKHQAIKNPSVRFNKPNFSNIKYFPASFKTIAKCRNT